MSTSKACTKCGAVKALEEFSRDKRKRDGRASVCKACERERAARYRAEHLEERREYDRMYSRRRVADGSKAEVYRRARARYTSRTSEQIAADRDRLRPDGLKRCRSCREYLPCSAFSINMTKRDGLSDSCRACHTEAKRRRRTAFYAPSWTDRDLYVCTYCAAPYEHADHVQPQADDGVDDPRNLVPACAACNLSKSDLDLFEWAPDLLAIVADWPVEVRALAA